MPESTSGAMYDGVPHAVVISSSEITFASPKSEILIAASGSGVVYSKFSG